MTMQDLIDEAEKLRAAYGVLPDEIRIEFAGDFQVYKQSGWTEDGIVSEMNVHSVKGKTIFVCQEPQK